MASTFAAADRRPVRRRRSARSRAWPHRRCPPGRRLGLGVAMIWFSLLVLIPLAAIVVTAAGGGWSTFVARR